MSFKNYIIEEMEKSKIATYQEVVDSISELWDKHFKNSTHTFDPKRVATFGTNFIRGSLRILNKDEYVNGIGDNDPLNINFKVEIKEDEIIVSYDRQSMRVAPNKPNRVYSSEKFGLRKFKSKDLNDFAKKLENHIKKIKTSIKKFESEGKLDVFKGRKLSNVSYDEFEAITKRL